MVEDRDDIMSHCRVVPQLLERLAMNPTAASSTSSLQDIPPSSAEPSPSVGGDFTSHISDALTIKSSAHTLTPVAPLYTATTYYESLGFPALLPVLCYSHNHYSTTLRAAAMHPDNLFNPAPFVTHTHYIYAVGENTNQRPNWVTTLFPIGHLTHQSTLNAIAAGVPVPFTDFSRGGRSSFPSGGRNSILIASSDLRDELTLNQWFTTPSRFYACKAYMSRVEFTPPELRNTFHNNALSRWKAMRIAHCQEQEAQGEVDPP